MKKVRLGLPMEFKECHGYLKITGDATEPFFDTGCKNSVPKEKCISLDVEIPEEIDLLGVTPPKESPTCERIAENWVFLFNAGWYISEGLKKVLVIMDGRIQEVRIEENQMRPDIRNWLTHEEDEWWNNMLWGIVVYVSNTRTWAILHWNTELANGIWN